MMIMTEKGKEIDDFGIRKKSLLLKLIQLLGKHGSVGGW